MNVRPWGLQFYSEVVAFATHLVEDEAWGTKDLIWFLEKPWKWEGEYNEWRKGQRDETQPAADHHVEGGR